MFFRRSKPRAALRPKFPTLPVGQIIYAIGDIHGRRDLLDELHWRIDLDHRQNGGKGLEIYLGDYVDRGTDSAGVISRLIERSKSKDIICLKGNHETLFEEFLVGKLELQVWNRLGGVETLRSYGIDPSALVSLTPQMRAQVVLAHLPSEHLLFLKSLRHSVQSGGYFFTHAGVRPGIPLDQQKPDDLETIRGPFLGDERDHGAIVVHGHTPCQEPEVFSNRINIDTGAYLTGKLTCVVIDHLGPQFLDYRRSFS